MTQGAGAVRGSEYPLSHGDVSSNTVHLTWKSWVTLPAYLLVFLMIVFPIVPKLSDIKLFLFVVILATVGVAVLTSGRLCLHPSVILWTLSLSALSCIFVLEGIVKGAPIIGSGSAAKIYVLWPVIYTLVIAGVRDNRILLGLIRTFIVSTICIAIYSILLLLIQTNILPVSSFTDLISFEQEDLGFGLHEGYIDMQYAGLNSLDFLVPFSIAVLVTCLPHLAGISWLRRACLWMAMLLSLGAVLVSGRRALYLVTLGAPFLTLLFLSFQPMDERRRSTKSLIRVAIGGVLALVILLVVLNAIYGVSLSGLKDRLATGFDFTPTTEDNGATYRRVQFHALLAGWMENPLLGAGYGMAAFGSIRSDVSPWNYELYYMAFLYQTGLVGFGAYATGILWIYWVGVQVIRSGGYLSAFMVPCLVGMSSILVANATNPSLPGYDTMWVIFSPLALINLWLLHRSAQQPFRRGFDLPKPTAGVTI